MDETALKNAFDYQRFRQNERLEAKIMSVYDAYLTDGYKLMDDALDISAAGEPALRVPRHSPQRDGHDD